MEFLAGVLDRSLGRVPVVQRRRQSLFEPEPMAARARVVPLDSRGQREATEEAPDGQTSAALEATAPQPPRAPSHRGARVPARMAATQDGEREAAGSEEAGAPIRVRESHAEHETHRGVPVSPREIQKPEPVAEAARARAPKRLQEWESENPPLHERLRRKPEEGMTPPPDSSPHDSTERRPTANSAREDSTRKSEPPRDLGVGRLVETMTVFPGQATPAQAGPPRLAHHPSPRPAAASRSTRAALPRETAPLAPTIHVTIGRIEIRAVAAATRPPRTPQPAAPRLSLEAYLRSRGTGR
jgi:hypothetical protein